MERSKDIKIIIAELQNHLSGSGLSAATLNDTRKRLNRLMRYCEKCPTSLYTEEVGRQYLEHECAQFPINSSNARKYRVLIDRLNCALNQVQWIPYIRKPKKLLRSCYDNLINEYISYLRRTGRTDSNIKAHNLNVYQFLIYIERQGCTEIGELTVNIIERAFIAATGKRHFSYFVGTFLKWLCLQEIITTDFRDALPKPIRHYGVPSVYSPTEVEVILSSFNHSTETGKRDYAMALIAARLGLRASDISGLKFENLRNDKGTVEIVQAKTRRPLTSSLLDEVSAAIDEYVKNGRPNSEDKHIFMKRGGYGVVSPHLVSHSISKAFIRSGIDCSKRKMGPHALRASLATALLNEGNNYSTIQKALGHHDIQQVKAYAKASIEDLRSCALAVPAASGAFLEGMMKQS